MDGTLIDSNDAHAHAWVEAFAESDLRVEFSRVRRAIGMGGDKLMPHVSSISAESAEGEAISRRRGEIFKDRYLPSLRPFPGVRELLERLAADGFTLVVASSAKEQELDPLLARAGVADLIARQTSSDDAERSKPDPDIVQAALARYRGAPAIMLGDTPYDVEAARRAGIAIVALESGGWRRDELGGAVQVYSSAAELLTRYDTSAFARLSRAMPAAGSGPRVDARAALLAGAGIAAAALCALTALALLRRGAAPAPEDPSTEHRGNPLSAADRRRLRRIIERTS